MSSPVVSEFTSINRKVFKMRFKHFEYGEKTQSRQLVQVNSCHGWKSRWICIIKSTIKTLKRTKLQQHLQQQDKT